MSIIHCYHLSFILISHRYYLSYHSGSLDRAAADKLGFGPGGVPEELLGDYSEEEVPKIPAAAISVEDAAMLRRMTARSPAVVVRLEMEAREEGTATSRNMMADIEGSEKPDEFVVVSGHIDSWDVGQVCVYISVY